MPEEGSSRNTTAGPTLSHHRPASWREDLVGVRRLEQRVGVAELVVADRVEQDPLRKLVRLAADEHGDPVLVRRHGDERGAGARDEGA